MSAGFWSFKSSLPSALSHQRVTEERSYFWLFVCLFRLGLQEQTQSSVVSDDFGPLKKNLLSICSWFRKSTRDQRPRQTPGQTFRCPSVPDPPQGAGQPSDFCTGSLSFPTVHLISEGGDSRHHSSFEFTSKNSARTYRAAVLDDRVAETGISLRSQLLAVRTSEDNSLLQEAALLVFVGHHIPAVNCDVLLRLCREKLEQLQLNCHHVLLLFSVSIMELHREAL